MFIQIVPEKSHEKASLHNSGKLSYPVIGLIESLRISTVAWLC